MIQREKIIAAFEAKAEHFKIFDREFHDDTALYEEKLAAFCASNYQDIISRLATFPSPGAIPAAEFNQAEAMVVRFREDWSSHEAARRWAYQTLLARPTFAADGSQIMPAKELSIPVAAVQIAWFENPHTPDGRYTKDTRFEVLTPDQLLIGRTPERQLSEQMVNLRRFQLEIETLCSYMERQAHKLSSDIKPPLVFFDSSMVISFAERWHEDQRKLFLQPVIKLLDTAQETGIPVVGYVDTTYACDLAVMLKYFFVLDIKRSPVHDAYLFRNMRWGDRTIFFTCARAGLLDEFGAHQRGVGFVYLKANQGLPARLDIPLWVYQRGLLDYVIDVVRAEIVVGTGYPYALATADAAAVISAQDREFFNAIFQQFITRENIDLQLSQKLRSKGYRR
ncbi:MAG: DNA double-strand break repair nuclease NurA [Acidobacteriota bacterium]